MKDFTSIVEFLKGPFLPYDQKWQQNFVSCCLFLAHEKKEGLLPLKDLFGIPYGVPYCYFLELSCALYEGHLKKIQEKFHLIFSFCLKKNTWELAELLEKLLGNYSSMAIGFLQFKNIADFERGVSSSLDFKILPSFLSLSQFFRLLEKIESPPLFIKDLRDFPLEQIFWNGPYLLWPRVAISLLLVFKTDQWMELLKEYLSVVPVSKEMSLYLKERWNITATNFLEKNYVEREIEGESIKKPKKGHKEKELEEYKKSGFNLKLKKALKDNNLSWSDVAECYWAQGLFLEGISYINSLRVKAEDIKQYYILEFLWGHYRETLDLSFLWQLEEELNQLPKSENLKFKKRELFWREEIRRYKNKEGFFNS